MLIDKIESISKDRSRIKLDTGECFVLYKGELRILKLGEGTELSDNSYKQIMTVILPKRAKLRCLNLLKQKAYTEYQLRKKLSEGGYPDSVSDEAISYVKSFGYIDDKKYAKDYIDSQCSSKSRKEMYLKLSQRGISREALDAVFNDTYGSYKDARDYEMQGETEVINKLLIKRGFTGKESYEEKQKFLAYFYRRGFDMDSVFKAMDSIND